MTMDIKRKIRRGEKEEIFRAYEAVRKNHTQFVCFPEDKVVITRMRGFMKRKEFRNELAALLNKHSLENVPNTPDYILADFLITCLDALDGAVNTRNIWHSAKDTRESEQLEQEQKPDDPFARLKELVSELPSDWSFSEHNLLISAIVEELLILKWEDVL